MPFASVRVEHQAFGLSSDSKRVVHPKKVMFSEMKGKTQSVPCAGPEMVVQVEPDLDLAPFSPD